MSGPDAAGQQRAGIGPDTIAQGPLHGFFLTVRIPAFTGACRAAMKTPRTLLALLLAPVLVCAGCAEEKPTVIFYPANGTEVRVTVELARTAGQRSMGLMYRKKIGAASGMLFLFEQDGRHRFTMRNTSIPLDMIFIDASPAVAGIVENTKPYASGPFGVDRPARYVLEVNAGFCARHAIAAGDRVAFVHVPGCETR
jgi:uncharacterized membrane protein (UPF0127 family)